MIYWRERYIYLSLIVLCFIILYIIPAQVQEGESQIVPYISVGTTLLVSIICFIRCLRNKEIVIKFPRKVLFMLVMLVFIYGVYIFIIETIGYFLLSIIFIALMMWLLKVKSIVKIILISTLVPLGVYLVLGELLNLRFPSGLFI